MNVSSKKRPSPTFGKLIGGGKGLRNFKTGVRVSPSFLCFEKREYNDDSSLKTDGMEPEGGDTGSDDASTDNSTYEKCFDYLTGSDSWTRFPKSDRGDSMNVATDNAYGYKRFMPFGIEGRVISISQEVPNADDHDEFLGDVMSISDDHEGVTLYMAGVARVYNSPSSSISTMTTREIIAFQTTTFDPSYKMGAWRTETFGPVEVLEDAKVTVLSNRSGTPINVDVRMHCICSPLSDYDGSLNCAVTPRTSTYDESVEGRYVPMSSSILLTHTISGGYAMSVRGVLKPNGSDDRTVKLLYGSIIEPGVYNMELTVMCAVSSRPGTKVNKYPLMTQEATKDGSLVKATSYLCGLGRINVPFKLSIPVTVKAGTDGSRFVASVPDYVDATSDYVKVAAGDFKNVGVLTPFVCRFHLDKFPKLFIT